MQHYRVHALFVIAFLICTIHLVMYLPGGMRQGLLSGLGSFFIAILLYLSVGSAVRRLAHKERAPGADKEGA